MTPTQKPSQMFTRADAVEHFSEVLEIVAELDPPADLRELTFRSVAEMMGTMTMDAPTEQNNGRKITPVSVLPTNLG